jgi:hypothetical protein
VRRILFLLFLFPSIGFGQFVDDFSDGNFSANPTWSGETSHFTVNGSFQLQSNGPAQTDTAWLHTTFNPTYTDTVIWEFYWRMAFAPSDNNTSRVYLMATSESLTSSANQGYYLRIGNNGNDSIRFYRNNGSSSTLMATGATNYSSNPALTVRVVRYPTGLWEIYSDPAAGNNYSLDISHTDATYTSSSKFGIWCKYTSSNNTKFYFDDFNLEGSLFVDTIAASMLSATASNSTQLDILFDEPVDPTSAQTASNYSVNNGIGIPTSAVLSNGSNTQVSLTFASSFPIAQPCEIYVSNVEDTVSNAIASDTANFIYYEFDNPNFRDLVINEIMADPSPVVGLPELEFIEMYNPSTSFFDLSALTLSDPSTTGSVTEFEFIAPGQHVILCKLADTNAFASFGKCIGLQNFPSLNNASDELTLRIDNVLIDQVAYTDNWYGDANKASGGYSLEQINPENPCTGQNNWRASTDSLGGTPGAVNSFFDNSPDTIRPKILAVSVENATSISVLFSEKMDSLSLIGASYFISNGNSINSVSVVSPSLQSVSLQLAQPLDSNLVYVIAASGAEDCTGNLIEGDSFEFGVGVKPFALDLVINELYPDPDPSSSIPDVEFIEVYNRSTKLLRLEFVQISDASTSSTLETTVLKPMEYLIICDDANASLFSEYGKVATVSSMPSLNNSSDVISLSLDSGLLDQVAYSDEWYGDASKENGGFTLERINPETECSSASNWRASNSVSGGTPGAVNSIFSLAPDLIAPEIASVLPIASNKIQVLFSESMDSASLVNSAYFISNSVSISSAQTGGAHPTFVELNSSNGIDSGVLYSLLILGATDCSGNALPSDSFEFGIGLTPQKFDLIINEIYPDPTEDSSLPNAEFVEIYNRSDKLLTLEGVRLGDRSSSSEIFSTNLLPNQYLIVCDDANAPLFAAFGKISPVSSMPSLNNSDDDLTLTLGLKVLDQVSYSDNWYGDEKSAGGGFTLERKNPENLCGLGTNWSASIASIGGTPGGENSNYDTTPVGSASLISGQFISMNQVLLKFNQRMDSASLSNSIVSANGSALNNQPIGSNFSSIIAISSKDFERGKVYQTTIDSSKNCAGENAGAQSISLYLHDSGDVVINEVLFDPRGSGSDFVELYNSSKYGINLQGWSLAYFDSKDSLRFNVISETSKSLSKGGYIALNEDNQDILINYYAAVDTNLFEMNLPSYSNSEGEVILYDQLGFQMDQFAYSVEMHFDLIDNYDGISLERLDPKRPSSDPGNWHSASSSVNYATPGYLNSQYYESLLSKSKFSLSSTYISPDNDEYQDVVNIDYLTSKTGLVASVNIYTDKGILVRELNSNLLLGSQGSITWDGTNDIGKKVRTGIHIILVETFDLEGNRGRYRLPVVVAAKL